MKTDLSKLLRDNFWFKTFVVKKKKPTRWQILKFQGIDFAKLIFVLMAVAFIILKGRCVLK